MKKNIVISPSLICADLCNLEREVRELEAAGMKSLHVDLLDAHFSPSIPIGLDVVKQLRSRTSMDFDVHVMSDINEFFIRELMKMNVQSVVFHTETTVHIEKMLQLIREGGSKAGVALAPATPLTVLDYVGKYCDYVLLMTINPGYAGGKSESMTAYALEKIRDCRQKLDEMGSKAQIVVDGRVSFEVMPDMIEAGAEVLVAGSKSIFAKGATYAENFQKAQQIINMCK